MSFLAFILIVLVLIVLFSPEKKVRHKGTHYTDIGYRNKKEYMASTEWKKLRMRIMIRDGFTCQVCGSNGTEVHHITYDRLGKERTEDLVLLCREHHQEIHNILGYEYTTSYPISVLTERK